MLTIIFLSLFSTEKAVANISLEQAYHASLKRSEDLATQGERVNQAEERYSQAVGAVLPNVSFVGSYLKQDAGSLTSIFPTEQKNYRFTATQPLFRGFREYAALSQQSILSKAARYTRDQAQIQLFQDIASSYYQVLMAETDLKNLQTSIELNQKRLKEIEDFRRIGRSRESEVLNIQANIAGLESQKESAMVLLSNAKAVFKFLTDLNEEVLSDQETFPTQLENIKYYLNRVEARPDVVAAIKNSEASDKGVSIAKGGHLPSIDLTGNYYLTRPGALQNVKWDVGLTLTFPIFQGGIVSSDVAIASSQRKQADLALERTKRQAMQEIESNYHQAHGDLVQLEKQKLAVSLHLKNYQAQLRDYRLGLVNNIEVIQALTASQDSQRQLDRLSYQFKMDYLRLLASTAERPHLSSTGEKK